MNRGVGDATYFQTWYMSRDWKFYRRFLADIIQNAEQGPILDVGAGLGYLVEAAQRWGISCVGLEGSEAAVEMGISRYPQLNVVHHKLSDPFPFADNHFGVVFFNQVIEHLEADVGQCAMREIHRVLKPNGMVLLFSPSRYNRREREEDPTHIHMYSPAELRNLLSGTGFERITALDEPLAFLGANRFGHRVMNKIFKMFPWDPLSSSANARAFKAGTVKKG